MNTFRPIDGSVRVATFCYDGLLHWCWKWFFKAFNWRGGHTNWALETTNIGVHIAATTTLAVLWKAAFQEKDMSGCTINQTYACKCFGVIDTSTHYATNIYVADIWVQQWNSNF